MCNIPVKSCFLRTGASAPRSANLLPALDPDAKTPSTDLGHHSAFRNPPTCSSGSQRTRKQPTVGLYLPVGEQSGTAVADKGGMRFVCRVFPFLRSACFGGFLLSPFFFSCLLTFAKILRATRRIRPSCGGPFKMLGILDKPSPPIVTGFSAPRFISRRLCFVFLFATVLLTIFVFSSDPLRQICDDGTYCHLTTLKDKFGAFGGNADGPKSSGKGPATSASEDGEKTDGGQTLINDECTYFPNTSNVLLVMKTGASESYSKVPTQLATHLKCLPDFLFFSDMAQNIAGYTIHDSLETVLDEVKESNKDFELYFRQKECPIDQEQCNKGHDVAKQGWDLDKYKNIHMAEKAYAMRPNHDWYLFVDADTYVVWPNLVKWLPHLNPSNKHYIGSVAYLGKQPFAHGGSGYLVSRAAMRAMFAGKKGVANKYDEPVQHVCCGDAMWSTALEEETGIKVVNAVRSKQLCIYCTVPEQLYPKV